MSAIEALPPAAERRNAERLSPAHSIRVTVGRGTGLVVDVSRTGIRVRHSAAAMRGSHLRVTFEWEKERFDATAEVLASRVASLGKTTLFDTRLRFTSMSESSLALLDRVLAAIRDSELRRWVSNLHGWTESAQASEETDDHGAFLRCRLIGMRWRTTWTQDPTQPDNGFAVPATIKPLELERLCNTFREADAEGRVLIRLMAEETVSESSSRESAARSVPGRTPAA
ncbi:MAG TPA: PilZ domain-containing protein [Thermoanaerobaculia bacterium]|nr:PilZ domain-containing protein [Thermoanaerobaculia bacterium]